jgi:hypothetical protein
MQVDERLKTNLQMNGRLKTRNEREESKGQSCPYENTKPPVRLQVGPIRHFVYIMASFKQLENCNGTDAVS